MKALVTSIALLAGVTGAAAGEADRFVLERTEDGYVRMDRMTGAMALCAIRDGELACRPAAEQSGQPALEARVAALEARIAALEGRAPAAGELPSDAEVDRAIGLMERFFKAFMDIVRGIEAESEQAPQKT